MEDISRELEREIAQTKPKPYKQDRKTRVLIIDDFGTMKSGEYLKKMVLTLSIASAVCFITAVVFIILYSGIAGRSGNIVQQLETAEKKVEALTREKEVLMARLVILGKKPVAPKPTEPKAEKPEGAKKVLEKKPLLAKKSEPVKSPAAAKAPKKVEKPAPAKEKKVAAAEQAQPAAAGKKMVNIEKFTVVKDGNNGDLLVRFDIRNTSTAPGDVNGRIFTLLKPENNDPSQWLVVPSSKLENGIPSERRKGQYFSIAHFKPVKFRIKNQASPDFFKKAAIYIFTPKGELMVEKLIDITEAQ